MIGIGDPEYLAIRLHAFADEVLAPCIHPHRQPLELAVWSTRERPSFPEAMAAGYQEVSVGHRWGPAWSTAWFRIRGPVPPDWPDHPLALRFSSGTEALLWQDGVPRQGLDANRDLARLQASAGESLELWVEAACNQPLGVSTFWWDDPEVRRRWQEDKPGRVECCELVTLDEEAWRFTETFRFAVNLATSLPQGSARSRSLLEGLRDLVRDLPAHAARAAMTGQAARLDRLVRGADGPPTTECVAVGHAHLDTAWLWPLAETRRKLQRSWTNVLRVMDRHPEFRFTASQAAHYAMLEEDRPALFQEVRQRVEEGRFEPCGAMWVEPDCTIPSGESLVRQVLHGTRYWESRFGKDLPQEVLYLPDTFGFPACLPQIMAGAGLRTFLTNKMSWCERNEFPFTTFRWRGLDGTEVLSHFTPGDNYNAPLQPKDLLHGEHKLLRKDHGTVGRRGAGLLCWAQPYGYGDGGGGPTPETALRAELAGHCEGLPRVHQDTLHGFAGRLHQAWQELRTTRQRDLPVWDGELYLELHRGTFTSQRWIKQANADLERRLRRVEALLTCARDQAQVAALQERLGGHWRTLLLHQFHDILPGTSIGLVYAEARAELDDLARRLEGIEEDLLQGLTGGGTSTDPDTLWLFNPSSTPRSEWIRHGDRWRYAAHLPPLTPVVRTLPSPDPGLGAVRADPHGLENDRVRVELDGAGRIARLVLKTHVDGSPAQEDRIVNAVAADGSLQALNQLVLYEDRPRRWEAWDVDFDLTDKAELLDGDADEVVVEEAGPVRGAVTVRRRFRDSEIHQTYVLKAGSPRLDVNTRVVWNERQTLLRARFPVQVRASHATVGTAFGHIQRATHRNTSQDEARFEVPGQRWMDLSQPGLGLAVLDPDLVGRSIEESTLALSLLRAPNDPDPEADRGTHAFTYSLLPHDGDWHAAQVPEEAEHLEPVLVRTATEDPPTTPTWHVDTCQGFPPEITCCKPAEDGDGLILRLVERHGGAAVWQLVHDASWIVDPVDLRERPLAGPALETDEDGTTLRAGPFQILTVRMRPGAPE